MVRRKTQHLYIIAGPNGSGKTTFVRRFLPYYADCINFVNADLIAAGPSPFSPDVPGDISIEVYEKDLEIDIIGRIMDQKQEIKF